MRLVESETLEFTKVPETKFKEVENHFIVVFQRKGTEEGPVTTVDDRWYEKWYEKWSEGLVERLVDGLVENQKKLLDLIMGNPYISKKEMAKRICISTTAIDKNIKTLKNKGLLRRIGPAKGGHWEIIE